MNVFTRALITGAASIAIAGVSAGVAAAAQPSTDSSVIQINTLNDKYVAGTQDLPGFVCPADHPYLFNHQYSPSMSINGVEVLSSMNDGVALEGPVLNPNGDHTVVGYGVGIASGPQVVSVNAYCTSDVTQAYHA